MHVAALITALRGTIGGRLYVCSASAWDGILTFKYTLDIVCGYVLSPCNSVLDGLSHKSHTGHKGWLVHCTAPWGKPTLPVSHRSCWPHRARQRIARRGYPRLSNPRRRCRQRFLASGPGLARSQSGDSAPTSSETNPPLLE